MIIVRRYLGLVGKLDYHYHKEGWILEAALVYCEAVTGLAQELDTADLKSSGLIAFREYVRNYVHSHGFHTLLTETKKVRAGLSEREI